MYKQLQWSELERLLRYVTSIITERFVGGSLERTCTHFGAIIDIKQWQHRDVMQWIEFILDNKEVASKFNMPLQELFQQASQESLLSLGVTQLGYRKKLQRQIELLRDGRWTLENYLVDKTILNWSHRDVVAWLAELMHMSEYLLCFKDVTGKHLIAFSGRDLLARGVLKLGHQKILLREIRALHDLACSPIPPCTAASSLQATGAGSFPTAKGIPYLRRKSSPSTFLPNACNVSSPRRKPFETLSLQAHSSGSFPFMVPRRSPKTHPCLTRRELFLQRLAPIQTSLANRKSADDIPLHNHSIPDALSEFQGRRHPKQLSHPHLHSSPFVWLKLSEISATLWVRSCVQFCLLTLSSPVFLLNTCVTEKNAEFCLVPVMRKWPLFLVH